MSLIDDFVTYYQTLGKAVRTGTEYAKEILYFAKFLQSSYPNAGLKLDELLMVADKTDAYAYMTKCLDKCNSTATRARKVSSLRQFYKYLLKQDLVSTNIFEVIDRPKVTHSLPTFLSLDDAKKLILTARSLGDLFYRRRNTCIIVWFLNTGMRLSELASIQLLDIYDDAVLIHGKGSKERMVYLNRACLKSYRLWLYYRGQDEGPLFISKSGQGLSPGSIATIVKSLIRKAGLPERVSTHKLRHTCATLLYQSHVADLLLLSEILGHSSVATTQVYTHIADERIKAAMDQHPLANFWPC